MSGNGGHSSKPEIDNTVLDRIVRKNYDLYIDKIKRLDGYEDLNFKITIRSKGDNAEKVEVPERDFVLKILNHEYTSNSQAVETCHKMMMYLYQHEIPVSVPVTTVTGHTYCSESLPLQCSDTEGLFLIQLLKFIPGVSFLDAGNPVGLMSEIGRLTGKMDHALKNFQGDISVDEDNLWTLQNLPKLAQYIPLHCSVEDSRMGQDIVQVYTQRLQPSLDKLQSGIIHGDVNNCNIIVKNISEANQLHNTPTYVISGLIDFLDAHSSFYVYELATIMADIMASCLHKHDPFVVAKALYKGYSEEFSLNTVEINSLKLTICGRLIQCYVLSGLSLVSEPDNVYIGLERQEYIDLCRLLWKVEDSEFLTKVTFCHERTLT